MCLFLDERNKGTDSRWYRQDSFAKFNMGYSSRDDSRDGGDETSPESVRLTIPQNYDFIPRENLEKEGYEKQFADYLLDSIR